MYILLSEIDLLFFQGKFFEKQKKNYLKNIFYYSVKMKNSPFLTEKRYLKYLKYNYCYKKGVHVRLEDQIQRRTQWLILFF